MVHTAAFDEQPAPSPQEQASKYKVHEDDTGQKPCILMGPSARPYCFDLEFVNTSGANVSHNGMHATTTLSVPFGWLEEVRYIVGDEVFRELLFQFLTRAVPRPFVREMAEVISQTLQRIKDEEQASM